MYPYTRLRAKKTKRLKKRSKARAKRMQPQSKKIGETGAPKKEDSNEAATFASAEKTVAPADVFAENKKLLLEKEQAAPRQSNNTSMYHRSFTQANFSIPTSFTNTATRRILSISMPRTSG